MDPKPNLVEPKSEEPPTLKLSAADPYTDFKNINEPNFLLAKGIGGLPPA